MGSKEELSGQGGKESLSHQQQSEQQDNPFQKIFKQSREELVERLNREQEAWAPPAAIGPEDMEGFYFHWEVLSPKAIHIFNLILNQQRDRDLLLAYAQKRGIDLKSVFQELRNWDYLDESDEEMYRIKFKEWEG